MTDRNRPLLLITNDDGIESPGLWALVEALIDDYDLLVAAPKHQQTNMGRGALTGPGIGTIEAFERTVKGRTIMAFGIHGSPAQSVAHGLLELVERMPDYCISGINYGENLGLAFTCSGTLGACFEGESFGIPGIAFSRIIPMNHQRLDTFADLDWDMEKHHVLKIVNKAITKGLPKGARILNVNFPGNLTEKTEVRVTSQAPISYGKYLKPMRQDLSRPIQLGWTLSEQLGQVEAHTDIYAIHIDGVVSVTPLSGIMSIPSEW